MGARDDQPRLNTPGRQRRFLPSVRLSSDAFGEFAEADPAEYRRALKNEGDLDALRDFERLFRRNGH